MAKTKGSEWTGAQIQTLVDLARGGTSMAIIAGKLGRSREAVASKFQEYCRALTPAARKAIWAERDGNIKLPQRGLAPRSQVVCRAARAALSPASITAAVLGDPLPGYSALDLKRQSTSTLTATGDTHASHH